MININYSEQKLFIVSRFLLGILFFKYFIDLIFDHNYVYFSFISEYNNDIAMAFGAVGSALSFLFAFGFRRRLVGALLSLTLVTFIFFSQFSGNVSLGYLSYLLLILTFVPEGESWNNNPNWKFPRDLMWVLWIITGISYFESGIDKLRNPYWIEGGAIVQLLKYTIAAKDNFITRFILDHEFIASFMNWFTIGIDIAFGLLFFFLPFRLILWVLMVFLHIGILFTMQLYHISYGMIIFHLFLLVDRDFVIPHWWRKKAS
jgi:hypothetical protein